MHSRYALITIYLLDQNIGLTSSFSLRSAKADTYYYGGASLDTKKKKKKKRGKLGGELTLQGSGRIERDCCMRESPSKICETDFSRFRV